MTLGRFAFWCLVCGSACGRYDGGAAAYSAPFFWPAANETATAAAETGVRARVEVADEALLMAVGRHSWFADSLIGSSGADDGERTEEGADADRLRHLQAATAVHLLQRLRFMEAADGALTAAADEAAAAATATERRAGDDPMRAFYEGLRSRVLDDGLLLKGWLEACAEARRWLDGLAPTRGRYAIRRLLPVRRLLAQLAGEAPLLRRLLVCSLFLETARAAQRHSKFARNVLRVARVHEAAPHAERIFAAAVEETATEVADAAHTERMRDTLFAKLYEKLRRDAELNAPSVRDSLLEAKRAP